MVLTPLACWPWPPQADPKVNVLKHAPHAADVVLGTTWDRPYSREQVRSAAGRVINGSPPSLHHQQRWAGCCETCSCAGQPLPAHPTPWVPLPAQAAYPASWVKDSKFWPTTSRVDNVYGDRHLVLRLPDATAQEVEPAAEAVAA